MDYPNPFTQDHLDCCNRTITRNTMALNLAKDLQDCGYDCSLQHEALKQQLDVATKTKAKFFPDQL